MILKQNIVEFITDKMESGTEPFYVYDTQTIREHCQAFKNIGYANKSIHFASMANCNPSFLDIVKQERVNIFVNSPIHLQTAMQVGWQGKEIIYTASALSKKTMMMLHELGAQVNLDSPGQLEQWERLLPDTPVGIRCNIGDKVKPQASYAGYFIGKESRLGFTLDELQIIGNKKNIKGLHLYVGTDIFDLDYFMACYGELADIGMSFDQLEYLNFGGGFGVPENGECRFDMTAYNRMVTGLMKDFSERKGTEIKLLLEPGRIIGGKAGFFACRITDIKKRGNEILVGVNASTAQFSRPLMYPDLADHPVAVVRDGRQLETEAEESCTIFGCSTYSRDFFAKKKMLPLLKQGDILVFGNAGTYSASSYTEFLGFPKPEEIFL
jgi:diaminopimelate decarboxylase